MSLAESVAAIFPATDFHHGQDELRRFTRGRPQAKMLWVFTFSMISVIFYKLGAFFAKHLPERLSVWITESIVKLQYRVRFRTRRHVEENLRIVLGLGSTGANLQQLTRRTFTNFGKSIYYFLRLPAMTTEELLMRCDSSGIEELANKLTDGFVIVGPHLGPWEVGGACLARLGFSIRTVAFPHPSNEVTRFFDRHRQRYGIESEPINGSVASLQKALNGGRGVALLIDRAYNSNAEVVRWFDRDIEMPVGHLVLAVRCRVPLLTCVCVFQDDGRFKLDWRGPYLPDTSLNYRGAIRELQDICVRDMETFIRTYPDQWFNFQPIEK